MKKQIDDRENRTAQKTSFEKSRHITDFFIAGFTYHDGLEVIEALTLGTQVDLVAEENNPYDPGAVAIYYKEMKLGYVPKEKNIHLNTFLSFGYENIFEARIQYANKEAYPEKQYRIVVKIKDNR